MNELDWKLRYLVTAGPNNKLWGLFPALHLAHEYIAQLIEEEGLKDSDICLYELSHRHFHVRTATVVED